MLAEEIVKQRSGFRSIFLLVMAIIAVAVVGGLIWWGIRNWPHRPAVENGGPIVGEEIAPADTATEAVTKLLMAIKKRQSVQPLVTARAANLELAPTWWIEQDAAETDTVILGQPISQSAEELLPGELGRARLEVLFLTKPSNSGFAEPQEKYFYDVVQLPSQGWLIDAVAYSLETTLAGIRLGAIAVDPDWLRAVQAELDAGDPDVPWDDPKETLFAQVPDVGFSVDEDAYSVITDSGTEVRYQIIHQGERFIAIVRQPGVSGPKGAWALTGVYLSPSL